MEKISESVLSGDSVEDSGVKNILEIDGVIGWDIDAKTVREVLSGFNDEDVEILINSPGGLVTDGIAIFNYIKSYKGKKVVKITGLAASMASYIAMAGDVVAVEENSIFMIHNASVNASGDFNDLKKASDISYNMSKILSNEYAKKSGLGVDRVQEMMNNETFFYGREILENGFADVLTASNIPFSKEAAILDSKTAIAFSCDLIKKLTNNNDNLELSACIDEIYKKKTMHSQNRHDSINIKMENDMTIDKLKAEFPDVYNDIYGKATIEERKRVAGILIWKGLSKEGDSILNEAIASGKKSEDIAQQMFIISQKKSVLDKDNAEIVETSKTTSVSGIDNCCGLDEDDIKACKIFNIEIDDYKKTKVVLNG